MFVALAFCLGVVCGMVAMAALSLTRAQAGGDRVAQPRR